MNKLKMRKVFFCLVILTLGIGSCNAQFFHKNPEKGLFGKSISKKQEKIKGPRKVIKAKKKQEANERKLKNDYEKSVKRSRGRTVDIQTPEVQERMKQNQKNSVIRDKEKKKNVKTRSKKAGRKYK